MLLLFLDTLEEHLTAYELSELVKLCLLTESSKGFKIEDLEGCDTMMSKITSTYRPYSRYNYNTRSGYGDNYLEWLGITTDASEVKGHLRRWHKNKKPFAYMQDGTKLTNGDTFDPRETVKVMEDYLEGVFPTKSRFEKS